MIDQDLVQAVDYAAEMMKQGVSAGLAIHKAAKRFKVERSEVAKLSSKRSAAHQRNMRDKNIRDHFEGYLSNGRI